MKYIILKKTSSKLRLIKITIKRAEPKQNNDNSISSTTLLNYAKSNNKLN